jgi:WD40 repeat protein/MinD-like ATPase involved in chromosome partitioning or flagellar assembly
MTEPAEARRGRVITFYSYKGGTGRTMLLANVAWILAAAGRRVLVIDWDLEAPGLHHYFTPFLLDPRLADSEGLIDLIVHYASEAVSVPEGDDKADARLARMADPTNYTVALDWRFPDKGVLHLLPAGRQNASYSTRVNSFDWRHFYEGLDGAAFFDHLRERVGAAYDYVLIDSRTGVSDTSGICSVQMPDTVVACFTANEQSTIGASGICESIKAHWKQLGVADERRIFPVMCRVEQAEKDKLENAREQARHLFTRTLRPLTEIEQDAYWSNAYEEVLAIFGDRRSYEGSVLAASEAVAANVSDGAVRRLEQQPSPPDRERILARYARKGQDRSFDAIAVLASGAWSEAEFVLDHLQAVARLKLATVSWLDLSAAMERRPSAPVLVFLGDGAVEDPDGALSRLATDTHRKVVTVKLPGAPVDAALPSPLAARPSIGFAPEGNREDALLSLQYLVAAGEVIDIDDARFADLRLRRRIATRAQEWIKSERSPDDLLRGSALAEAEQWLARTGEALAMSERDFLEASRAAQEESDLTQRLAAAQRAEAQALGRLDEANKQRRRGWGVAVGLLFGTVILALFAIKEFNRAESARLEASAARIEIDREVARLIGLARDAGTAKPVFGLLLLAEAVQRSQNSLGIPTADARQALLDQLAVVGGRALVSYPLAPVTSLDVAPDGSFIAAASQDRSTRIWNARSGELLNTLSPMTNSITALRVSGSGSRLAIGGEDGAVRVVDRRSGKAVLNLAGGSLGPVQAIEFDSNETMVFVTAGADIVRVHAIENGESLALPREIVQLEPSIALARPTNGDAFFANNSGDVLIASLERRGKDLSIVTSTLAGRLFRGRVTAVATSRDGRILVAGSVDRAVAALRWGDGQRLDGTLPLDTAVKSLDASDGTQEGTVVVGLSTSGRLAVTDLATAAPLQIGFLQQGKFSLAAIAPAGDTVLTVTNDNIAHLTCLVGAQPTADLRGHDAEITAARLDPESRFAATASRDGAIRIWYLRRGGGSGTTGCRGLDVLPKTDSTAISQTISAADLLAKTRLAVGRNFTAEEWKQTFPEEPRRATFTDLD